MVEIVNAPSIEVAMEEYPHYMTAAQVADWLQVPRSWIYAHTAAGDIPCIRVGKYLRFWPPHVLDWLKSNDTVMAA